MSTTDKTQNLERNLEALTASWLRFRKHPDCYDGRDVLRMARRIGMTKRMLFDLDGIWRD